MINFLYAVTNDKYRHANLPLTLSSVGYHSDVCIVKNKEGTTYNYMFTIDSVMFPLAKKVKDMIEFCKFDLILYVDTIETCPKSFLDSVKIYRMLQSVLQGKAFSTSDLTNFDQFIYNYVEILKEYDNAYYRKYNLFYTILIDKLKSKEI